MKKIKVSEATNTQLDWLIAGLEGEAESAVTKGYVTGKGRPCGKYSPTADGNQLVPIWEREGICTRGVVGGFYAWYPQCPPKSHDARLLVAVARCYVVSKLGEEVEVPEELT